MTTPNTSAASPAITLPTLAEGASLKLTDSRPAADADFITKKGRPVDVVCVDHAVVETGKGTAAVRLLFVVTAGQDDQDNDVTGRNIVTDKYLSTGALPYTFADLRLMGWKVVDGQEEAAMALLDGDASKSGLGSKTMRIDLKMEDFNKQLVQRVAGISQPPQKLDAAAIKTKLSGADILAALKKSKDGRPAFDKGGGSGGTSQPRNPTSPPPAVQSGTATRGDDPLPF